MITPQRFKSQVTNIRYLNPITLEVTLTIVEPDEMQFIPGQFISVSVGDGKFRSYSIASNHLDTKNIILALTVSHEGVGANYMKSLKVGDFVQFIGPAGKFTLPDVLAPNILFLVTGTGLTPIASILRQLQDLKTNTSIRLYFGLKSSKNIFYDDLLMQCKRDLPDFDYYICLSEPDHHWEGLRGQITKFYTIPDLHTTQVFVCGNPNMVHDVLNQLRERGVPEQNIFHEKFTISAGSTN